jgi:CarD family transcriptional regulator
MAAKALSFDVGDYVVYPKHGVGRVVELQSTEIAGTSLDLYVLRFEKEKMTLRVPVLKADSVGMRKLSSDKTMKDALETLKGKPKVKRTMWSRRAQEYEAKINSGDLTSIAEVVRDLFRPDDAPEQSYSERQIFEAASSRLARELAAMEQVDEPTALTKILEILNIAAAIHNKAKEAAAYAASALALLWIAAALLRISRICFNAVGSSASSIAPSSRARRDEAASKICRSE